MEDGGSLARRPHGEGNVECVCLSVLQRQSHRVSAVDLDDEYFGGRSPSCSPRESSRSWPWVRINIIGRKCRVTGKLVQTVLCVKQRTPKPNPLNLFLALLGVLSFCLAVDVTVPLLETGAALFVSAAVSDTQGVFCCSCKSATCKDFDLMSQVYPYSNYED